MGRMGEFMEKLTNPVLDYLEVLEGKQKLRKLPSAKKKGKK